MEWKQQNKKARAIAAPRPVAPMSLKHSGTTLPVYMPEFSDEPTDNSYDMEAESELQQIFGCARFTPGPDLLENLDDAMSIEAGEYPFFALGSPTDVGHLEFPRLGPSPISFRQVGENEPIYCSIPSRARNPVTRNTPFSPPKDLALHLEYQSTFPAAMTQTLKLALVGPCMDHQARTRNRSYSEPIPLYVE